MDHTLYERLARLELRLEMLASQVAALAPSQAHVAARQQVIRDGIRLLAISALAALVASGKVSPEHVALWLKALPG